MSNNGTKMETALKQAGWVKKLEGWLDPVKGDKVRIGTAWQRYLKRINQEHSGNAPECSSTAQSTLN